MAVKTSWVRIGRSGETIDGRVIEPEWLTQAAENYDKEFFSAPVWPGHSTWYRLGTVLALKADGNKEGGVDLYAIIEPNEYYRQAVKSGQMLHTSMELRPNFRNNGTWYLQGLAATDEPASVGTSQMQFSQHGGDHTGSVFTDFTENKQHTFKDDDQPPRWFSKLFGNKPNEDNMASKEFEQLKAQLDALAAKFAAAEPVEEGTDATETDGITELTAKVDQLTDQLQALTETVAAGSPPAENPDNGSEQFENFKSELQALSEKLDTAMNAQDGTDAGENLGNGMKASDYK